jgi:outer membrane receptor for ferrienterochelin and colicin
MVQIGPRSGVDSVIAVLRWDKKLNKRSKRSTLHMKRATLLVATALALVLAGVADTFAQGIQTGTIRGTITDQQELPVPGVSVTISSPALQGQRSTVSAGDGTYVFRTLPPGQYQVRFEISAFSPAERTVNVPLGLTVEQNVVLQAAGVTEQVQVIAETPAPLATPTIAANYKNAEVDALPTLRTLTGITLLAPGVTENSSTSGQININGAMGHDNIFMLNGVDVDDNVFGYAQELFIEDAIEETQVLTSGISAEYGRFTGGVVNAITKSGGNTFSGSGRINLQSPNWTDETPFEDSRGIERVDDLQQVYEGTFGGPILRDQLWFFAAGRKAETSTNTPLPESGVPRNTVRENTRGELKFTGTILQNHTLQGGYLNNPYTDTERPSFSFSIDPNTFDFRTLENDYIFANYRGVLKNDLLLEAQFSRRTFGFRGSGGGDLTITNQPFIDINIGEWHYNAPYFSEDDPENRNNKQFTGNLTYFLDTESAGRHELKTGYEWFRSQRTGGNSQSPTGYVFRADYVTDADGAPVFGPDGRMIPIFEPGVSRIENWISSRGAELNVDTNSIFAQDHWVINDRLSADLGIRFESAKTEATGGIIGVDSTSLVPRLAASYDLRGDGAHVFHVTYGWYSGKYLETQIGANNNVGNPDYLELEYQGPAGQGLGFAPGFDLANYRTTTGEFPTANVFVADGLGAPLSKEFTASYGVSFLNARGFAEGSYIHRSTDNLLEDFFTREGGQTTVIRDGVNFGTFTNVIWDNSDVAFRTYDGLLFQSRFNIMRNWSAHGNYTLQLRNEGNYNGENTNQPGVPSLIGDYPEAFNEARNYPSGRLPFGFQRHRARLWTIYTAEMGRLGDASFSFLMRVDNNGVYSHTAAVPLTAIQLARLEAAGYPDAPSSQTVYFGERGLEEFPNYSVFDIGVGYNIPVYRSVRPWIRVDLYNAFNNQKVVEWNTTVRADNASPRDELGLPTGFTRGPSYGQPTSASHYAIPYNGVTGGRTLRMAFGVRF